MDLKGIKGQTILGQGEGKVGGEGPEGGGTIAMAVPIAPMTISNFMIYDTRNLV